MKVQVNECTQTGEKHLKLRNSEKKKEKQFRKKQSVRANRRFKESEAKVYGAIREFKEQYKLK